MQLIELTLSHETSTVYSLNILTFKTVQIDPNKIEYIFQDEDIDYRTYCILSVGSKEFIYQGTSINLREEIQRLTNPLRRALNDG